MKTIRNILLQVLLMLIIFPLALISREKTKPAQKPQFRAAVVKKDITPSGPQMLLGYQARKSTGIHDRIYNRIIILDDGTKKFILVSTDNCQFSPSQYDKVALMLEKEFGIGPADFWWSATHTHSAPELGPPGLEAVFMGERFEHKFDTEYQALVENSILEGIREGLVRLAPARLGTGWGYSQANINRRAIDTDGKAKLGLNPDGPVDRRIGIIRIDKATGDPLAIIANYAIHGTVLSGSNLEISGDVPGIVSEYVEEKTGAPLLFINGALGNMAPIYSVYPDPRSGHLSQFRVLLGDKILEAYQKVSTSENVTLNTSAAIVETPRKEMGWSDDLPDYTRTTKDGKNIIRLPVKFLKINNEVAIWSAPLELFCEISNEIRDLSPFPYTFYFGVTNGCLGYMLTEKEYEHGGYEPTDSPFTPVAASDLTNVVSKYITGEMLTLDNSTKIHHRSKK